MIKFSDGQRAMSDTFETEERAVAFVSDDSAGSAQTRTGTKSSGQRVKRHRRSAYGPDHWIAKLSLAALARTQVDKRITNEAAKSVNREMEKSGGDPICLLQATAFTTPDHTTHPCQDLSCCASVNAG